MWIQKGHFPPVETFICMLMKENLLHVDSLIVAEKNYRGNESRWLIRHNEEGYVFLDWDRQRLHIQTGFSSLSGVKDWK